MSWRRAALQGTRLVRSGSGSGSAGRLGGVVGAAASGYGARRAGHGGFGVARRPRRGPDRAVGAGASFPGAGWALGGRREPGEGGR